MYYLYKDDADSDYPYLAECYTKSQLCWFSKEEILCENPAEVFYKDNFDVGHSDVEEAEEASEYIVMSLIGVVEDLRELKVLVMLGE